MVDIMRYGGRWGCVVAAVFGSSGLWAQQQTGTVTFTEIATFNEHTQADAPSGPLVSGFKGALYGSTAYGNMNEGAIFELTPPVSGGGAWTRTVLFEFGGGVHGGYPAGGLVFDTQGNLYGVAPYGGIVQQNNACFAGCGVAFQLQPPATSGGLWTEKILHTFTGGSDGATPQGPLAMKNGILYGTANTNAAPVTGCDYQGATGGCGVVFALTPPGSHGSGWTYQVLHAFTGGADGARPLSGPVFGQNGALYGTTAIGGMSNGGTIYRLQPPSTVGGPWVESVLYSLNGSSDGTSPLGLSVGPGGVLYGAAYEGGDASCFLGCGTVFQLAPPAQAGTPWNFGVIFSFTSSAQGGANPTSLVAGYGVLVGANQTGGTRDVGLIFVLTPPSMASASWNQTVLCDIGDHLTAFPLGLSLGSAGTLYGATQGGWSLYGGSHYIGPGTVFQLTP